MRPPALPCRLHRSHPRCSARRPRIRSARSHSRLAATADRIRSRESALAAAGRPEEEAFPVRHGTATFLAFVLAGAVPLLPYALGASISIGLTISVLLTFATLFAVGASRALVTVSRWWTAGLEMLGLGLAVALAAYVSGAIVSRLVDGA